MSDLTTVQPLHRVNVLDHGHVELVDSMGNDLSVVRAAQASFNRASDMYGEREAGILRFLMREQHGVPFEHVVFTFRLRLPVFVARQLVKHRMSSWSEHSARYSELEPEFYLPQVFRSQTGKPGAYTFSEAGAFTQTVGTAAMREACHTAWAQYRRMIECGVAKEQARLVLPVNIYTSATWTLNARSLLNMAHLRSDAHAQHETRVYSDAMVELARTVVPDTIAAWDEFGRSAI